MAAATPKLKAVDGVAGVTGPRDANENKGASAAGAAEAVSKLKDFVEAANEGAGEAAGAWKAAPKNPMAA